MGEMGIFERALHKIKAELFQPPKPPETLEELQKRYDSLMARREAYWKSLVGMGRRLRDFKLEDELNAGITDCLQKIAALTRPEYTPQKTRW